MGKVLANVKVFVGLLAARGTSLTSILSSLVGFLKRTYNWTPLCFLIICFLVRIVFGVNVNRAFLLF